MDVVQVVVVRVMDLVVSLCRGEREHDVADAHMLARHTIGYEYGTAP